MTTIVKRIVLIVASLIMLIGATGCMENNNNNTTTIKLDDARAAVLDYLTQKYGVSFECVGYQEPTLTNNEYTFALVETGKSYEGYGFKAHYSPNPEEGISDGYFGVLVRDEIAGFVLDHNLYDDCKVFVEVSRNTFDSKLNSSSTLTDAVRIHGKLRVYYHVFISSKCKFDITRLKDSVPSDMVSGKLSYYIISDEELDKIVYDNLNSTIGGIVDGTISVVSKGEFDF